MLAGIGGLLAATISLGYSVYDQRDVGIVPEVQLGTSVDAGRGRVAVMSVAVGTTKPDGLRTMEGKKTIKLDMMLENISAESSNLYRDLIELDDVPESLKPEYYLQRDRSILWDLQPRMPQAVTAVWEVPAELPLPNVLRLRIEGAIFKARDNLYAAPGWFP